MPSSIFRRTVTPKSRRRSRRVVRAIAAPWVNTTPKPASTYLSDTSTHTPPSSGTYDYDTFRPSRRQFPAVGDYYTDPVFGGVLQRVTNIFPNAGEDDNYARNGFWNSNGTAYQFTTGSWDGGGVHYIINPSTGATVRTGAPTSIGGEPQFAPDDPDVMYWITGATLKAYSLASGTSSTIKTFPASLEPVGGSLDYVSSNGRYFVVAYSSAYHVWDKTTDTIYTGAISDHPFDAGWVAITPSGSHVVVACSTDGCKYSYAINHSGQSVATSGTMFWSLGGDHGDLCSNNSGEYLICFENNSVGALYRVDITLTQTTTGGGPAQQLAQNTMLLNNNWDDGHVSVGGNYVWLADAKSTDTFASQGTWAAYRQEIIRIRVDTGAVERYAHHRSRSVSNAYRYYPRISSFWDGSKAIFASNMAYDNGGGSAGYADLWMLEAASSGYLPNHIGIGITTGI